MTLENLAVKDVPGELDVADTDTSRHLFSDSFEFGLAKPQSAQQELPERFWPIKEIFSGKTITGISREFLKNLTTDSTGRYHGAGLRYPDIMADPDMKKYIENQNQATLSRIDKTILEQEVKNEIKAASYKLPSDWNARASRPGKMIDLSFGGSSGSMSVDGREYTLTDAGASNRKLVVSDSSGASKTLIAEPKDFTIEQVVQVSVEGSNKFAVVGSIDGASALYVYDSNGKQERQIALPGYGSIYDVRQGSNPAELKFLYATPISSPQVVTLDLADGKHSISAPDKNAFNTDNFVTDKLMVDYVDKDGEPQRVPVFVSHNKDMKLDGKNPALVEIYGGLNMVPQWLSYYPHSSSWLERGGVIVNPILPGDGGLGTNNHKLGVAAGIENTGLATIAAVKEIQKLDISSPETTGIYAQSYGGMVTNTVLNSRPELFGAAVTDSAINSLFDSPEINVDTGKYWIDTLGDPTDSQQAEWMSKLDVLSNLTRNLSANKKYPDTLIEIGTLDGVVNVGNAISYASIRQEMDKSETLLYARKGEGHMPESLELPTAFLWDRLNNA